MVAAVKDNLIVDDHLNLYNLQDLTRKLSGLGQQGVLFRILPAMPVQIGGVDYLQMANAINPTAVMNLVNSMVPKALWENQCYDLSDCTYFEGPVLVTHGETLIEDL